ncbi:MAG: hypothetical protein M0R03_22875 [Novosphingobium sp.]|nr:hypothetical protein [Novosphingobium sp.]
MINKEEVSKKLLEELYEQYVKLFSSIKYYEEKNKEVLESGVDKEREELKALREEPLKSDGLSEEEIKEAKFKNAMEIQKLSERIDYYEKLVEDIKRLKNSVNETIYHYNFIYTQAQNNDLEMKPFIK